MAFAGIYVAGATLSATFGAAHLNSAAITQPSPEKRTFMKMVAETVHTITAAFFIVTATALIGTEIACIVGLGMGVALMATPFLSYQLQRPWLKQVNSMIHTASKVMTSLISISFATIAAGPFGTIASVLLVLGQY